MFRKALYAGTASATVGVCGVLAYCADKVSSRRIVYDMTDDHITSLENQPDLQLKFVQVFFRHGARTPLSEIKALEPVEWKSEEIFSGAKHTYIDYDIKSLDGGPLPDAQVEKLYRKHKLLHGGAHIGQLTSVGMDHCYKLGQRLRKHYQYKLKFLPKTFSSEDFYFRSTNIQRTIESLRCVVAGLCSPLKDPIDIFVSKSAEETLYPNSHHCPILRDFHRAIYKNTDFIPGMRPHRLEIQQLLGMKAEEHIDFVNIRDVVKAREAHSLFLPDFLSSRMDHIDEQASHVMTYAVGGRTGGKIDRDVLQVNAGNLVHLITTNLENAAKNQDKSAKLHLYSCHDTSIIPALLVVDGWKNQWPDWAADIIFELYEDKKGQSYVRTLYLGEEVVLRGTKGGLVTLDKFKEIVKPFSLRFDEFEHLCQHPKKASVSASKTSLF